MATKKKTLTVDPSKLYVLAVDGEMCEWSPYVFNIFTSKETAQIVLSQQDEQEQDSIFIITLKELMTCIR